MILYYDIILYYYIIYYYIIYYYIQFITKINSPLSCDVVGRSATKSWLELTELTMSRANFTRPE